LYYLSAQSTVTRPITKKSVDTSNYIMDKTQHEVKDKLQAGTEGKAH
jgi:hypothetical protein